MTRGIETSYEHTQSHGDIIQESQSRSRLETAYLVGITAHFRTIFALIKSDKSSSVKKERLKSFKHASGSVRLYIDTL